MTTAIKTGTAAGTQAAGSPGICRYPGCASPARVKDPAAPGPRPGYCEQEVPEDRGDGTAVLVPHTAMTAFRHPQQLARQPGPDRPGTPALTPAPALRAHAPPPTSRPGAPPPALPDPRPRAGAPRRPPPPPGARRPRRPPPPPPPPPPRGPPPTAPPAGRPPPPPRPRAPRPRARAEHPPPPGLLPDISPSRPAAPASN